MAGPVITSFAAPGDPAGTPRTGSLSEAGRYARALARLAGRATRAERPVPPDERTVLDLVAVLAGGRNAARATAHCAAAYSYIEEHLTDPNLGADQIAAAIGISERQLSRVFAAEGTSVPRHILTRRLTLAHSLLTGPAPEQAAAAQAGAAEAGPPQAAPPQACPEQVAVIAARCGFTSASYFSHAFRQRFGYRATDLRPR
jgi:AraC-like DNA-binding protein